MKCQGSMTFVEHSLIQSIMITLGRIKMGIWSLERKQMTEYDCVLLIFLQKHGHISQMNHGEHSVSRQEFSMEVFNRIGSNKNIETPKCVRISACIKNKKKSQIWQNEDFVILHFLGQRKPQPQRLTCLKKVEEVWRWIEDDDRQDLL